MTKRRFVQIYKDLGWASALLVFVMVGAFLISTTAEAKYRGGGFSGRSYSSRSYSAPSRSYTAPKYTAPKPYTPVKPTVPTPVKPVPDVKPRPAVRPQRSHTSRRVADSSPSYFSANNFWFLTSMLLLVNNIDNASDRDCDNYVLNDCKH